MRRIYSLITLCLALAACSTMTIRSDHDTEADFSDLKKYTWAPEALEPRTDVVDNSLLQSRIHNAVEARLAEQGYEKTESDKADFLVDYHVAKKDKVKVTSAPVYTRYGAQTVDIASDVYEYVEGTLILDVLGPETKNILWRGWAEAEIMPNHSPEKREARLNEAVKKILEKFPPK